MALCFLLSCYKFKNNKKFNLFFYLVDHGLRKNSSQRGKISKKTIKIKKNKFKNFKMERKKTKFKFTKFSKTKAI